MVDPGADEFNNLNTGKITPEYIFTNAYTEEIHESGQVRTYTKQLRVILDDKYEKEELYKVMKNQCQTFTETKRSELLKLLQKFKDFMMEHLAPDK